MWGIDAGYGWTKIVGSSSLKFPSIIGKARARNLVSEPATLLDELHVEVDGQEWFVGELARREAVDASIVLDRDRMVLRNSTFPVFVICDEPHQYLRSAKTWRNALVESRKWRFCYVMCLHTLEQLPPHIVPIMLAAGPHLHIYSTSKLTYKALQEEISPFTLEEAMRTPRYWAINVIRAGGRTITPFLAQMAAPPSSRRNTQGACQAPGQERLSCSNGDLG
ncbi:MAG: hypothetical protein PWR07_1126 [Bacillota bacterium]|nr:hypothetical protein [Bacillota bacterium]